MDLKKTTKEDLETLFVFQTDEMSNQMAAFTSEDPNDKGAYMDKWTKIITNPEINMQTIRVESRIIGSVVHFSMGEEVNISYWIDRQEWGKGFATKALMQFMAEATKDIFYAQVTFDNYGSQKVLEKCGFKKIEIEKGFANARKEEIEEFVYRWER